MNQFLCSKYSYGQSSLEVNLNHKSDPWIISVITNCSRIRSICCTQLSDIKGIFCKVLYVPILGLVQVRFTGGMDPFP